MFTTLVQKRRSIRKFLKKQVEPEKLEVLVEAALRSPSSMGKNSWEFIAVTDPGLLEKLSRAKPTGAAFLKDAPLGIVVCTDPGKSDVWVEDASIASAFILLAAESIGLGACWIQIRQRKHSETMTSEKYISEVLGIPETLKVAAIMAVGYPDEKKAPRDKSELPYEKVHIDSYGKGYKGS
jgi:nitroreductase